MRTHRLRNASVLVAATAALALGLTACSSSSGGGGGSSGSSSSGGAGGNANASIGSKFTGVLASCQHDIDNCNSGKGKAGATVSYVLEKTIPGWNVNTAEDFTFEVQEIYDVISPPVFNTTPSYKPVLNTDLMSSATETKTSPQTIVYKINPKAVWNDGSPVSAADFIYEKDTSDGTTCPAAKCIPGSTAGYSDIQSLTSSGGGKTVTMVMKTPFIDWKSLFGDLQPSHIAAQHGGITTGSQLAASFGYFAKTVPTWSDGPYVISNYQSNQAITMTPNPKWYGAVKPGLSKLIFRIITDQTQEPDALQNSEVQAIYPQPNLSLVQGVSSQQGVSTALTGGLEWEHLDFNEKNQFLKDVNLRRALFTAFDRKSMITRTVGQFDPGLPADNSRMYVPGQAGYVDNVTASKQGSGDVTLAKSILTKAGYTGVGSSLKTKSGQAVHFRCLYSAGNSERQTICELIQASAKQLGIKVTLQTTTDLSELSKGDYDLVIFAWTGAPFPSAGAQQIWELKGGGDYGMNNDPKAEALINKAASASSTTAEAKYLNAADKLLTNDAYSLPLFQKPQYLAIKDNLVGLRNNTTGYGPPYNVMSWAEKSS